MYGKLNKNIGFSLIIFAFFFLFEPTYALYDLLPDVIGYSVLLIALINLADISTRVSEAFCGFRKALLLSILRLILIYVLDAVFAEGEKILGLLIFVFILAVAEIVVLIPAYRALFAGLLTLGMFHDSEAVYFQKKKGKANATEKLYRLTVAFIIVKNILCALPDFTTLQTNSSYEFITILRVFACIIVMPLSTAWLLSSVRYFVSLKNDTGFVESLSNEYMKISQNFPNFYTFRVIKVGLCSMIAAFVLSFDVYSENINVLPDIFFYILLLLSLLFLGRYSRNKSAGIVVSVFGALTSIALYITEKGFFSDYPYITAIKREADAYYRYYAMLFLYILQGLIFVCTVVLVLRFLRDVFYEHAPFFKDSDPIKRKELHKSFRTRVRITKAASVLSAVGSVYHIWSLPFQGKGWYFYYSGIFSFMFSVFFIIAICSLISYILSEVRYNYRLHI